MGASLSVPCFPTRRWPTPTHRALPGPVCPLPSHTCCAGSGWALAAPALTSMGPLPAGVPLSPQQDTSPSGQSLICWSQALPTTWLGSTSLLLSHFSWAGQELGPRGQTTWEYSPQGSQCSAAERQIPRRAPLDLSTLRPRFKPRLSLVWPTLLPLPSRGFSSVDRVLAGKFISQPLVQVS